MQPSASAPSRSNAPHRLFVAYIFGVPTNNVALISFAGINAHSRNR